MVSTRPRVVQGALRSRWTEVVEDLLVAVDERGGRGLLLAYCKVLEMNRAKKRLLRKRLHN